MRSTDLATLALPEDEPPHPVRDLTQASRALDRARGQLELDLGRRFRLRSDSWLLVDGSLAESPEWATDPRTIGVSKSHATLPFEGDDLDRYLRLPLGHRTSIFAPQTRSVAPVYAWALRLWDWETKDLFHGLVRVEVAPANGVPRDRGPALPQAPGRARADQHARSPVGSAALRHSLRRAVSSGPRGGAGLMARALAALAGREFDVLVVGGGITGAVTAWDAAQRGLSVALLERGDFGGATSAESLKVVHGGVRYLQHLDIVRVRESSRERRALLRMAPHLVHPMPFVVPTYGHGMRGPEILAAAFVLLNALTADRNRGLTDPSRRVPAARIVSRARVLEWFPEHQPGRADGGRGLLRRADVQPAPAGLGHGPDRRARRRGGGELLRRDRADAPGWTGHRCPGGRPSGRRASSRCAPAPS